MAHRLATKYPLLGALLAALALFLVSADTALAHERVEVGPYLFIIGWENEPPVVGDRNFITIEISRGDERVVEAEASLDLTVEYGGRTFSANLNPTSTPGFYRVDMYPTVRGQYLVKFTGTLGDTAVDFEAEPEEVLPAAVLQFPESPPDTIELQSQIDNLAAQLDTARLLAIGGIVVGIIGIIVGAAGLLRKRT